MRHLVRRYTPVYPVAALFPLHFRVLIHRHAFTRDPTEERLQGTLDGKHIVS